MKATEQYFPECGLTYCATEGGPHFESMDASRPNFNESWKALLSYDAFPFNNLL